MLFVYLPESFFGPQFITISFLFKRIYNAVPG